MEDDETCYNLVLPLGGWCQKPGTTGTVGYTCVIVGHFVLVQKSAKLDQ